MITAKNSRKLARGTTAALEATVRFVDAAYETVERETKRVSKLVEFFDVDAREGGADVREKLNNIHAECRAIATAVYCSANAIVRYRNVGAVVAEANKVAEQEDRVVELRRAAVALLSEEGAR
ncbi:MAG: hypothetical protein IJE77_06840 [Thermoguttaceae bacterium]|jgi:hypothetical protein|nr:hypothetical protein [Thermoguttaceae bacterium]MBQ9799018.1 hypothetical protein [Thermoguttaceae bacterium]